MNGKKDRMITEIKGGQGGWVSMRQEWGQSVDAVHGNPLSSAMCKVGNYVYISDREGVYV